MDDISRWLDDVVRGVKDHSASVQKSTGDVEVIKLCEGFRICCEISATDVRLQTTLLDERLPSESSDLLLRALQAAYAMGQESGRAESTSWLFNGWERRRTVLHENGRKTKDARSNALPDKGNVLSALKKARTEKPNANNRAVVMAAGKKLSPPIGRDRLYKLISKFEIEKKDWEPVPGA